MRPLATPYIVHIYHIHKYVCEYKLQSINIAFTPLRPFWFLFLVLSVPLLVLGFLGLVCTLLSLTVICCMQHDLQFKTKRTIWRFIFLLFLYAFVCRALLFFYIYLHTYVCAYLCKCVFVAQKEAISGVSSVSALAFCHFLWRLLCSAFVYTFFFLLFIFIFAILFVQLHATHTHIFIYIHAYALTWHERKSRSIK